MIRIQELLFDVSSAQSLIGSRTGLTCYPGPLGRGTHGDVFNGITKVAEAKWPNLYERGIKFIHRGQYGHTPLQKIRLQEVGSYNRFS